MEKVWQTLSLSHRAQVELRSTLCRGQCFRWTMTDFGTFVGVVQDRAFELRVAKMDIRGNGAVEYRRLGIKKPPATMRPTTPTVRGRQRGAAVRDGAARGTTASLHGVTDETVLVAYLSLDMDMSAMWRAWVEENPHRQHPLAQFLLKGVNTEERTQLPFSLIRLLRQDVHQTVFEFLCSQNNHIKRITKLVQSLCTACGDLICVYDLARGDIAERQVEHGPTALPLHTFPTIDQLSTLTEEKLRDLGFGYRAKYIAGTVAAIKQARHTSTNATFQPVPVLGGWYQHAECQTEPFYRDLLALSAATTTAHGDLAAQQALREKLLTLPGVGRKVADCVLLFALDQHDIVPVDTHIIQVASTYLSPASPTRKSTKSTNQRTRKRSRSPNGLSESSWELVLREWKAKQSARGATPKPRAAVKKGVSAGPAAAASPAVTVSTKEHDAIQEGFRVLLGPYCGWAHYNIFAWIANAS